MSTDSVIHDTERQAFVLKQDGDEVLLRYRLQGDNQIEFFSTFTPVSLRGRGLARVVVDEGLDYAEAHHLRVTPTCSYVAKVLQQRQAQS